MMIIIIAIMLTIVSLFQIYNNHFALHAKSMIPFFALPRRCLYVYIYITGYTIYQLSTYILAILLLFSLLQRLHKNQFVGVAARYANITQYLYSFVCFFIHPSY